ncbi:hypothetical protein [Limnoglobus roseus]|uniref:Uncharacterized protein n=1 Tax=Limnoglobus roseus TaxID=2598579 RepID=A0A5C1AG24_9BACT|nr:hypothetical protein [Limnoglobus roseus]QEL18161.1 hypothetical protein PX52LOC_05175 [Limnoglobus roseus]
MPTRLDAGQQVMAMLERGWVWKDAFSDILVHPTDHTLAVQFDRASNVLRLSPALVQAVSLVIPTRGGKKRRS